MPALTLSIHKFLNIEQTLQKLETFPKTYLRTIIWFDTLYSCDLMFSRQRDFDSLVFDFCIFLPFVKKCIIVAFN